MKHKERTFVQKKYRSDSSVEDEEIEFIKSLDLDKDFDDVRRNLYKLDEERKVAELNEQRARYTRSMQFLDAFGTLIILAVILFAIMYWRG